MDRKKSIDFTAKARQLAGDILFAEDIAPGLIYYSSNNFIDFIADLIDFNIRDTIDQVNNTSIMTEYGKAVSPQVAAMCGIEFMRNYCFQKGVYAAIQDQLKQCKNKPISLLYAGTGPFATIILPAILVCSPSDIRVTLLEISETSLSYLKKLIDKLELGEFIDDYVLADATSWQPDSGVKYNIIVSETMKAMLVQEPQAFVMSNLIDFLADNGVWLPENIKLVAEYHHHSSDFKLAMNEVIDESDIIPPEQIGILFELNKTSAKAIREQGYQQVMRGELIIPQFLRDNIGKYDVLHYTTYISVYGDFELKPVDCSLNIPEKIDIKSQPAFSRIQYQYKVQEQYPRFYFSYK